MNRAQAGKLGLRDGDSVRVRQGGGEAVVAYAIDDKLPAECIRLAAAREETAALGDAHAELSVERVAGQQVTQKVAV
jgi:NADH-quinone oxidoreductase subunit G